MAIYGRYGILTNTANLSGGSSGGGMNCISSVNGILPDASGNIALVAPSVIVNDPLVNYTFKAVGIGYEFEQCSVKWSSTTYRFTVDLSEIVKDTTSDSYRLRLVLQNTGTGTFKVKFVTGGNYFWTLEGYYSNSISDYSVTKFAVLDIMSTPATAPMFLPIYVGV